MRSLAIKLKPDKNKNNDKDKVCVCALPLPSKLESTYMTVETDRQVDNSANPPWGSLYGKLVFHIINLDAHRELSRPVEAGEWRVASGTWHGVRL